MKKIAIIGGHGQVGRMIVQQLWLYGKKNLIIMGRNNEKMQQFAQTISPEIEVRQIDLTQPVDEQCLVDLQMVIVCLDQRTTAFVEQCQKLGIDYLDVTANSHFLKQVCTFSSPLSRTLIGIGLAPGITNLAVAQYLKESSKTKSIAIDILLGMGDQHGPAAIAWTFSQLNRSYPHANWSKPIDTFTLRKKSAFGLRYGKKFTYNFDFADQHLLAYYDATRNYTTYLGFDLNWVTQSLAMLKKTKLTTIFKSKMVLTFLSWVMSKSLIGSDEFVVKISNGQKNDPKQLLISGHEEAKMTGQVAAFVAMKLIDTPIHAGNYVINDVTTLHEVIENIPSLTIDRN